MNGQLHALAVTRTSRLTWCLEWGRQQAVPVMPAVNHAPSNKVVAAEMQVQVTPTVQTSAAEFA